MSIPKTSNNFPLSFLTQPSGKDENQKVKDLISDTYKDRLTTLPKHKGWYSENIYLYQGFWYESVRDIDSVVIIMASQDRFIAQPTDIYLATLPKSGTTWLKALSFAIINRDRYKINSLSTHPLQILNPHKCVPTIEIQMPTGNSPYVEGHSPRLFTTHMAYTSLPQSVLKSGCRIVYICRNPKDVLVSLFHFANKLRDKSLERLTFTEAFEMFSKGVSSCGPYWDHVKEYYMAALDHPNKILFLNYDDMQKDTLNNVKRLAQFLGYPFTEQEEVEGVVQQIIKLCNFESLREVNKHGYIITGVPNDVFFREGKVGGWTNYLTNEMSQVLDQITNEKFHGLDITF